MATKDKNVNIVDQERAAIAESAPGSRITRANRVTTPAVADLPGRDRPAGSGTVGEDRNERELEDAEQRRWMAWLSLPFASEALSVGLVFGTGDGWWLALSLPSIFATVLILIQLVLSSDTNGLVESAHPQVDLVRSVAAATGMGGTLP